MTYGKCVYDTWITTMAIFTWTAWITHFKFPDWSKQVPFDFSHIILLPSATKLRRLCFYRCVSVHRGGGGIPACLAAGLQGGVLSQHALQQVSRGRSAPGGCLVQGGSAPGGVSAPRDWCLVRRGLVQGGPGPGGCLLQGVSAPRGAGIPACTEADPPPGRDGYCCGRYASHWNAFLF